jgi:hypothetical protein
MWEVPQSSVGYTNLSANIWFALVTYEMYTAETRRCNIAVPYHTVSYGRHDIMGNETMDHQSGLAVTTSIIQRFVNITEEGLTLS